MGALRRVGGFGSEQQNDRKAKKSALQEFSGEILLKNTNVFGQKMQKKPAKIRGGCEIRGLQYFHDIHEDLQFLG